MVVNIGDFAKLHFVHCEIAVTGDTDLGAIYVKHDAKTGCMYS